MPRSKGSSVMDQAIEDLKNQFAQLQQETHRVREEDLERSQRRDSHMQDLIVSTICNQLKTVRDQLIQAVSKEVKERMMRFENRYEPFLRDNPDGGTRVEIEEENSSPLVVSNFRNERTNIPLQRGVVGGVEVNRREFRMQLPRVEFPNFCGDNPLEWVRKCSYFFEINQIPEGYKTQYASMYFQGKADEWYGGFLMEHDPPPWEELVELVQKRFKKKGSKSAVDEFKRLHQMGTVEEYMDKFEGAKSQLLLDDRHFPESFYVEAFISGLKEEIKPFVNAFKPSSLTDAYEYSLHMEVACENQYKRLKGNTKLFVGSNHTYQNKATLDKSKPTFQPNPPVNTNTRNALIDQRRALGLCFKCGDKYFPGHQCKVKVHMMMGEDDEEGVEKEGEEEELQTHYHQFTDAIEAVVSMHATSSNPNLKTMKFKGHIGKRSVYALLDSGSTHNFVDPAILQGVNCKIVKTQPMIVMVANGEKMVTDSKCCNLPFSI